MNLLTLDLETTLNAPAEIGKSHPMFSGNEIVLLGTRLSEDSVVTCLGRLDLPHLFVDLGMDLDFVVGCNLSFDLCYLYREDEAYKKALQKHRLWDIQLAEYLLSGQQDKWPSLDKMSLKYGLPVKDSKITTYFESGIGADKIPLEELEPYLMQDLANTEAIAKKQMITATQNSMLNLIISQMEALHCITEMMFNGLAVDYPYLEKYAAQVATEYADVKSNLEKQVKAPLKEYINFYPVEDVDSALQWSKFLFGGNLKVPDYEVIGTYKNGKTKTRKITKIVKTLAACDVPASPDWVSEKTGKISVDDKTITTIIEKTKNSYIKELVTALHTYRDLAKQLSTYIQGLSKHVQTKAGVVSLRRYVYGRLNQVATSTGRLSSTSPNLQNISNNPIKKVFVSRWCGEIYSGSLVEFDFAQLEVAVLAHVTKDKQLIEDISTGKDIHTELYQEMFLKTPTKEERKWFKTMTFGLIYGAGAKTLAENAKCSINIAKQFVETFYKRYPDIYAWHTYMHGEATRMGKYEELDITKTWRWHSETGRIYVFKEYASKYEAGKTNNFSPTELKNYPIQGLATGDIVPLMLGVLFRKLILKPGVKLINTVHDSIMLDIRDDVLKETIKEIQNVLNNTHMFFEKTFGFPLALKLSAGVTVGKNWFEQESYDG